MSSVRTRGLSALLQSPQRLYTTGPRQVYNQRVSSGKYRADPHQQKTVEHLQRLYDTLQSHPPPPVTPVNYDDGDPRGPHRVGLEQMDAQAAVLKSLFRFVSGTVTGRNRPASQARTMNQPGPRGLYLHGDVGSGKTMTMDLFYHSLGSIERKRRVHFHAFMQDVHRRVHQLRKERNVTYDPIPPIAHELANDAWVLCFDELQVTDVGDAMILRRLFTELYARGVVTVVTSNRPPDELYKNGLQRKSFLPTIEVLKERNLVHPLDSGIDYRQQAKGSEQVFFYPLGPPTTTSIEKIWASLTVKEKVQPKMLEFLGRTLTISETCDRVARASFALLCSSSHSAADFLALAGQFDTLILTDVPKMSLVQRNEARRFITLIDALYENKIKLYMSSEVEASLLLVGDAEEAANTGKERELTAADRQLMDDLKLQVDHLTSSIFTGAEEAFAFQRAVSRLVEMQSANWGKRDEP